MSAVTALRVTYPYTGEVVGEVPISGRAEVVATLDRAAGRPVPPRHERARILFAVADRLAGRRSAR